MALSDNFSVLKKFKEFDFDMTCSMSVDIVMASNSSQATKYGIEMKFCHPVAVSRQIARAKSFVTEGKRLYCMQLNFIEVIDVVLSFR